MANQISGFLFIGDPHLSSKKPGRRKDKLFDYTVLGKIEQSINVANENNLLPVFLGDIFDRPTEESESVKIKLLRVLKKSIHKPVSNIGNHDIQHSKISDSDSITLLEEAGAIDLIRENGKYGEYKIGETIIGIGGTPYGYSIPQDVTEYFAEAKKVIWITHHDLAFEGSYPGSTELFAIKGCNLVVNGHMHLTKKIVQMDNTTWFNPGNITRQTADTRDHKPRVWSFNDKGKIEPIALSYEKDAFNLTGRLVDPENYESSVSEGMESVFVSLMENELSSDLEKTDDGSIILEKIEEKLKSKKMDNNMQGYILELLKEVSK